jgi:hypothetical protein
MGHARYIGRVGALAVALGVGMAIASTPGIAQAQPSDSSSSAGGSGAKGSAASTASAAPGDSAPSSASGSSQGGSGSAGSSPSRRVSAAGTDATSDDSSGLKSATVSDTADAKRSRPGELGRGGGTPVVKDKPVDSASLSSDSDATKDGASGAVSARTVTAPTVTDVLDAAPAKDAGGSAKISAPPQSLRIAAVTSTPVIPAVTTTVTTAVDDATAAISAPDTPPATGVVGIVSNFVSALLSPLAGTDDGSPTQLPILSMMLLAVRNELDRISLSDNAVAAPQQTTSLPNAGAPGSVAGDNQVGQHVLVIGVDGTNLSRVLADDYNQNFFRLMDTSTTAAASIVGHTTISNPSWTAILTGVWGERTGVINNVFTPWTYDTWPTVFNQLETQNPDLYTMAIADWNVISGIAGAGNIPVDRNILVPQVEGDTRWLETDDLVGDATVAAISSPYAPNFLFSYFVGVDENGHQFGGASPQYAEAIRNIDDNLGAIMDAVSTREAATGEDWTILVVTDHGHQPQLGFGHGFQTTDETATFVIADGPNFRDGYINTEYEIVDTTPTVVSLFGGTPRPGSDGVPLTSLSFYDVKPDNLRQALEDQIARNTEPDFATSAALALRTIFATIPYYVYNFRTDITSSVPDFLAGPVTLFFDGLYVATNIPAQIVAYLTGVTGASIFPLLPPPPPMPSSAQPDPAPGVGSVA